MSQKINLGYGDSVLRSEKAIVYLEYNPSRLPPKPSASDDGGRWTRFVCLSDTHSKSFGVPDGDVLLHSGDLTHSGTTSSLKKATEWLCSLPHRVKIIIAGNHDLALHESWYDQNFSRFHGKDKQDLDQIRDLFQGPQATEANLIYLQDQVHKFAVHEGGREWSVFGSPWSPTFGNWAFNYDRENGEALVAKIPKTDILLTHGPPYQIFDRVTRGSDVGCEALRARLPFLKPRLHVFGHIHEAHGAYIHTWKNDLASGQEEPPLVQNSNIPDLIDDQYLGDAHDVPEEGDEHTVFVNAANSPKGNLAIREGVRLNICGGPGFQPVVVDLRD